MWLFIQLNYQLLLKLVIVSPTTVLVFELPAQCEILFLEDIAYTLGVNLFWPFGVSKLFDSGGVRGKLRLFANFTCNFCWNLVFKILLRHFLSPILHWPFFIWNLALPIFHCPFLDFWCCGHITKVFNRTNVSRAVLQTLSLLIH